MAANDDPHPPKAASAVSGFLATLLGSSFAARAFRARLCTALCSLTTLACTFTLRAVLVFAFGRWRGWCRGTLTLQAPELLAAWGRLGVSDSFIRV